MKGKRTDSSGNTRSIYDPKTSCHIEIREATQSMYEVNTTMALPRGKKEKSFTIRNLVCNPMPGFNRLARISQGNNTSTNRLKCSRCAHFSQICFCILLL